MMSAEKITQLEKEQETQAYKILSLEKTIDAMFPPLIEQLKEVSSRLGANTEAVLKSTLAQEHLSEDVKKLEDSSTEKWKRINDIEKTQAANQVVINAVKGLGGKMLALGLTVIIAAIGVAVAVSKSLT